MYNSEAQGHQLTVSENRGTELSFTKKEGVQTRPASEEILNVLDKKLNGVTDTGSPGDPEQFDIPASPTSQHEIMRFPQRVHKGKVVSLDPTSAP